jgi:hypothetical protein
MFRVAVVCEGPADRAIIEAVLDHYLDDYQPLPIQPPITNVGGDSGPFGGGWKGVRTWSEQEASGPGGIQTILANADLLVIQVDADVAIDPEISREHPCPPPSGNADEVRALVLRWLGLAWVPNRVVLCVPSMGSETWALVGLFPNDPSTTPCDPPPRDAVCIECRLDVKAVLRRLGKKLRPKLVVSQDGELKNQATGYRSQQVGLKLTGAWPNIVRTCSEAQRFDADLRRVLS